MADTIEIVVGDSFAERHRQLAEKLGEEYEVTMRENVEDVLHTLTKQIERSTEQQLMTEDGHGGLNSTSAGVESSISENVD